VLALLLGGHPDDLDLVADLQRRDAALGGAPGHKREVQPVLEGVVPPHGLFFGRVGVDDDFHGDALLPLLVARSSLHLVSSFAYQALLRPIAAERPGRSRRDRCHLTRAGPRKHVSSASPVSRPAR
jgi:hypothetical protein